MPTLAQLREEQVWRDEYVPESIKTTRALLLTHFNWPSWRIGHIGNELHLWGYHRSRRWILSSRYCTNRTRSVTETEGNRNGGTGNEIAGIDIITSEAHARKIHANLNAARAAGRLPFVRQIILESGPWHNHVSIDRGMLDFNPRTLVAVITGGATEGKRMVVVQATMPELRQGSNEEAVGTWQTLANRRGASLKVDNDFGPLTDAATREIQHRYGAESVDGIVGPETWAIGLAGEDQN